MDRNNRHFDELFELFFKIISDLSQTQINNCMKSFLKFAIKKAGLLGVRRRSVRMSLNPEFEVFFDILAQERYLIVKGIYREAIERSGLLDVDLHRGKETKKVESAIELEISIWEKKINAEKLLLEAYKVKIKATQEFELALNQKQLAEEEYNQFFISQINQKQITK